MNGYERNVIEMKIDENVALRFDGKMKVLIFSISSKFTLKFLFEKDTCSRLVRDKWNTH